jgi:hypothetical protein
MSAVMGEHKNRQTAARTIGRVNVRCSVEYDVDGTATPRVIYWPDGRSFFVERVIARQRSVPAVGDCEKTRFTCVIHGEEKFVYWDGFRWYVEGKLGSWQ